MRFISHACLLTFLCVLMVWTSCATPQQDESGLPVALLEKDAKKESREGDDWRPPSPVADGSDWIRMSSGEWLRGELIFFREDHLEFDSDDLGDLEIDWDDVTELRSPRMNACLFTDGSTALGTLLIRDGWLIVGDREKGERRVERTMLRTIIPGEPRELNYWSGKVGLGLTTRSGNTDQTDWSGYVHLVRRTLESRYTFDYLGSYGKLDGEKNIETHRINTKHDLFLTRRLYWTTLSMEAFRDIFQNIDHRLTPATGLGYELYNRKDLSWEVEGLVGLQYIRYDSVTEDQDRTESESVALANTLYELEITDDIDFELEYRLQMSSSSLGKANQHTRTGISIDLVGLLDLNVMFVWDRQGDPEREASGETPNKSDYRLVVGLEFDF